MPAQHRPRAARVPSHAAFLAAWAVTVFGAVFVALAVLLPLPAHAAGASGTGGAQAAGLTPAEAATIATIMADPQKRAAMVAAMQAVAAQAVAAQAAGPAGSAPPAKPPTGPAAAPALAATIAAAAAGAAGAAAAPAPVVPLAPDSVGAQVLAQANSMLRNTARIADWVNERLTGFTAAGRYFATVIADPDKRQAVATAYGAAIAALLAAIAADALVRLALGGARRWIERHAPARPPRQARLGTRLLHGLRVLLANLGLLLLALLASAAAASAGLAAVPLLGAVPTEAIESLVLAFTASRVAEAMAAFLAAPNAAGLRLLRLDDHAAAYLVRAVRNVCLTGAAGFSLVELASQNGLPDAAYTAFVKLVLLLVAGVLCGIVLDCRHAVARVIARDADRTSLTGRVRLRAARVWHLAAIFFILGLWGAFALQWRNGVWRLGFIFIASIATPVLLQFITGRAIAALERFIAGSGSLGGLGFDLEARLRRWQGVLHWLIRATALVLTAGLVAWVWGYDLRAAFTGRALGGRLASALGAIVLAGFAAVLLYETVNGALETRIGRAMRDGDLSGAARLRTLLPILRTVLSLLLGVVFGVVALQEIGIDTGPILAGAGIIGVAIGFGSQKLVQDFITGIFLLLENAMQVGDWVTVSGLSGTVEALSIRTMRLRAQDGSVHLIPFSAVSTVTNVHRGLGNAAFSITVPIGSDIERVFALLRDTAAEMREAPDYADLIRAEINIMGVDRLEAGVATILAQLACTDSGKLAVQREFNRRLAQRMAEVGIRISAPMQTVLHSPL